jgi:hypothetical protein
MIFSRRDAKAQRNSNPQSVVQSLENIALRLGVFARNNIEAIFLRKKRNTPLDI